LYLQEAIKRINDINWDEYGKKEPFEDSGRYANEYLRRSAIFFKETSLNPENPLHTNIAELMGYSYDEKTNILNLCSIEARNALTRSFPSYIVEFYLQLSKAADSNSDMAKYLEIYEPAIRLIELGQKFAYKEKGFMIFDVGFLPMNDWYNRFVNREPQEIS